MISSRALYVAFESHEKYSGQKSSEVAQLLAQQDNTRYHSLDVRPPTLNPYRTTLEPSSGGDSQLLRGSRDGDQGQRQQSKTDKIEMLVYVSKKYTEDGTIREEYISGMQKASSDAMALGISPAFIKKYITPCLEYKSAVPSSSVRIQGKGLTPGQRSAQKRSDRNEAKVEDEKRSKFQFT